jgi:hypothetical protein
MRACAITLDVHDVAEVDDLRAAHDALTARGFPATYFVPSGLLADARMRDTLRTIERDGGELGAHGHLHDMAEQRALATGQGSLAFLERSTRTLEDLLGRSPRAFRSPCWCGLSDPAKDRLAELGYRIDSSATPQRLGLFSSSPFENPWIASPRAPYLVRPSLLEVPTSSFVIPFGSLSLALLRGPGASVFASALATEARLTDSVVVFQLHAGDFVPSSAPQRPRKSWRDLFPRRGHGFAARHWVLDLDGPRMLARVDAVLALLRHAHLEPLTMSRLDERIRPQEGKRARVDRAGVEARA